MARKKSKSRALNAFNTAVDDETYIKGLRQQQDIDLELVADDEIRKLVSGQVDPEDDEDIDSDEAMGSASDISLGEPDLSDEEEWGNSLDEAELVPLSEAWDMDDAEQDESHPENISREPHAESQTSLVSRSASENEAGELSDAESSVEGDSDDANSDTDGDKSDGESSEEDIWSNESDEELDSEDDEAFARAISRAAAGEDKESHRLKVGAGNENPFALPPSASGDNKLTLEDLGFGKDAAPKPRAKRDGQPLAMPLPQRVQQRTDRGASYEVAKEKISEWEPTVAANRRAEHLVFPMQPTQFEAVSPFSVSQRNKTDPESLEGKVAALLEQSNLSNEADAQTFEDLAPSKLSFEELKERRDQIRQRRELMFREEQRAKRIKKIKSKSYRRVHKKERERMAELMAEDEEVNEEDLVRQRALERASLRHKTSSKWAKRMADQGMTRDGDTRAEMEEMLRQSDDLRRRVLDHGSGDDDDDDYGDYNIASENTKLQQDEANAPERPKGVMGMKFMMDAEARKREENNRLLQDDYAEQDTKTPGRRSFTPAGSSLKRELSRQAEDDPEDSDQGQGNGRYDHKSRTKRSRVDTGSVEVITRPAPLTASPGRDNAVTDGEEMPSASDNPWLQMSTTKGKATYTNMADASRGNHSKSKSTRSRDSHSKPVDISTSNTLSDTLVRESSLTFEQQDLVRRAFAGDDVVAEFEAEKQQLIEDEGDKEIDDTLPGWGSWSNEKPRVQHIRKVKGIDPKSRKDAKRQNVIINERINKKATSRYSASAVPFPFENRAQYERSLRMPIGQEWVSRDTFQRQTKPRLIVKRGEIIDPLKAPIKK